MTASVADWISYAQARGTTVANDAASAAALIRAGDYIARFYTNRLTVTAPESVIDAATYEAAALELATPGFFSKTFTAAEQKVLTGVGDLRWTVRGDAAGADAATPISTTIEALFYPYMQRRDGGASMLLTVGRSSGL
ncbi:hypothetical protein [Sagittula sp. S175]|uniref:hypothetical protein n=1 Tax=Sagittula sp. S175 TaxID=3415129 RepID=UPI003C7EB1C2